MKETMLRISSTVLITAPENSYRCCHSITLGHAVDQFNLLKRDATECRMAGPSSFFS